jgi:hypothetical protein
MTGDGRAMRWFGRAMDRRCREGTMPYKLSRLVLLLLLGMLVSSSPVTAVTSLESRIQTATGIVRVVDAALQARAQVRAVEIQTNFAHCCLSQHEAEVIAWNGEPDPIAYLVTQWLNSPAHAAILRDPSYRSIGCAMATGTRLDNLGLTYGVCILSAAVAAPNVPPAPPATIPDTAMEQP